MKSFFLVVALINVVHFFDVLIERDINKEQGIQVYHVITKGEPAVKYYKFKGNRSPSVVSNR